MLAASGELDDRPGGPYVPTDRTDSGEVVVDESAAGATRRSVYLQQRRTQIASLLEVFDAPSIVTTCTRRLPSTIPLQSLSLLNSDFVVARARKLAERLERECRSRETEPIRRPHRPGLPADDRPRAETGRARRRPAVPGNPARPLPRPGRTRGPPPRLGRLLPDAAGQQRIPLCRVNRP